LIVDMSEDGKPAAVPGRDGARDERQRRLADALRANLARRKAQRRARGQGRAGGSEGCSEGCSEGGDGGGDDCGGETAPAETEP
jgi:hypothetical protein